MPNPYISQVTLPSGSTYDIKDQGARDLIDELEQYSEYLGVTTTELTDGSSVNPITINGDSVTAKKGEIANYGSKEFIFNGTVWQEFGDLGALGDLAYKDTASGSTSVNVPATYTSTFTGEASSISASGTTTGSVNVTKSAVTVSKASSGTATYTPQGSNAASSVSGSCTITPSGSISTGSGTANYTPSGTVAAPTITVDTAGATTSVAEVASVGSMPTYTVANEVLTITAGAVPTTNSVTVKTGDASYTSSAPAFTGTGVDLEFSGTEVTGTVTGTAAAQTFTGTGARLVTDSQVATDASFVGDTMSITGNVTPTGSVSTTTATTESKTINVTVS